LSTLFFYLLSLFGYLNPLKHRYRKKTVSLTQMFFLSYQLNRSCIAERFRKKHIVQHSRFSSIWCGFLMKMFSDVLSDIGGFPSFHSRESDRVGPEDLVSMV